MIRPAILILATLAATTATAAERRFANTGFNKVVVEASDNVAIARGGFAITATGDQADLDRLELRQEGDTLRIGRKKGDWSWRSKGVQLRVSLPALSAVTVSGSGNAAADQAGGAAVALRVSGSGNLAVQAVKATALTASLSGSGNVAAGNVVAETVAASISGSGNMAVAGRCTSLDARLSGSGDLVADKLACTNATVSTSGSGDVSVHASGQVTARTSGSGDVVITGGARCTSRSSGSGTIRCN
jgi:dipeptidyl aminopeptidase/acylaminoacyl peptidase